MNRSSAKGGQYTDPQRPADIPGGEQEETEMTRQQSEQAQQIVETGAVTPTKGKYTIHCLTIVGQTVIIDNEYLYGYITASESPF